VLAVVDAASPSAGVAHLQCDLAASLVNRLRQSFQPGDLGIVIRTQCVDIQFAVGLNRREFHEA